MTPNEPNPPAPVNFGDNVEGAVAPSANTQAIPAGTVEAPPQPALTVPVSQNLPVVQKSFSIFIGIIVVAFIAVMLKRSSSSTQK